MAEIALLQLDDVSKFFRVKEKFWGTADRLLAVDHVSLKLEKGQSLGLVGESGCGKSTLAKIACGLVAPDSGCVRLNDLDLPLAGHGSWASGKIQMIFQDPASSLDPRLSVLASVAEPLRASGMGRKESSHAAEEILAAVGLSGMGCRYPHQFSGGQRQRVAVARALTTRPEVIICDEPVSALDASVQAQILNLLRDMQERFNPAYLFISHDLAVIGFMCPRIIVMYLGQIVEEASREELFAKAAHPYSVALLQAMPRGEKAWQKGEGLETLPPPLPGEAPNQLHPPDGCRFHPRCPKVKDICRREPPPWREVAAGWRCRCHFPNI